ncbi:MAG: GNAT family N-acetyltransferase [Candidatus Thorarchaeota archaeon]|nr:GNAT family N-acetyltransferase [Candidatus Thorarchaeota archaeon]
MSYSSSQQVWEIMRMNLVPFLGDEVHIVIPDSWSNQYEQWFKDIEMQSFRETLRYTTEELQTRMKKKQVLLLFILVGANPEGMILGYALEESQGTTFYLDTFAVKTRGKGIGKIMLSSIIKWATQNEFSAIVLDTEAENEIGIPLQQFYENMGFVVECIEDDGNITMRLIL